jgi:hypothetical protein
MDSHDQTGAGPTGTASASAATAVALCGLPEAIGTTWGQVHGQVIRRELETHFLAPARARELEPDELSARRDVFARLAADLAPHWLDEMAAVARAAAVDPELYLSYVANVHRQLFLHDECTSYAVGRRWTRDGALLFHKNRDNVERPQTACVVASCLPGIQTYVTVSDASVPACMMMVNQAGLAGSADTGGLPVGRPRYRGLMNTFLLRYLAERTTTCTEALEVLADAVGRGLYAGGHATGTHWLLVDRHGSILEVSHNSDQLQHTWHTDEQLYFSVRADSPASARLGQAGEPVGFGLFHAVSRDPSVCFPSSIAGMTVEIDPDYPELLTRAWIALPARSLAVPVFTGQRRTPAALFDGRLHGAGRDLAAPAGLWEAMERGTHASALVLGAQARALLGEGGREAAAGLLAEWSVQQADAGLAVLEALAGGSPVGELG